MVHRKFNNFITIMVVVFGAYILSALVLPYLYFWWGQQVGFNVPAYAVVSQTKQDVNSYAIPSENRLVLPVIGLNEEILEGYGTATVNNGVWHRPSSSTPPKDGNTVLVGHRFSFSNSVKHPFYYLDKVKVGDSIVVAWEGKIYRYTVSEVKTVPPTEVSVEDNTPDARLTLYTCTPLWTSTNRLVIIAKPEAKNE
jgi:sortase A